MQHAEKRNICKINLLHQNKVDHQLFLQILVTLLRNSKKYVVSRVVPGAHSGALKVALLRSMTIQSAF